MMFEEDYDWKTVDMIPGQFNKKIVYFITDAERWKLKKAMATEFFTADIRSKI